MNRDEFKFLTVNTQELWQAGHIEDGINVTQEGIALEQSYSYGWTDISFDDIVTPVSLDLDSCGILYILDNVRKRVYLLDLGDGQSYWLDCISFCDPKSIALTDSDVYIVHDGKISCLARTNYQIRWQQDVRQEIRIAAQTKNRVYTVYLGSDQDQEPIKGDRRWKPIPIYLKDENGNHYELGNAVDIACDDEKYLFSLNIDYRQYLQDGNVDQHLIEVFKDKGVIISDTAKVRRKADKEAWEINDRIIYTVEVARGELNIYLADSIYVLDADNAKNRGKILKFNHHGEIIEPIPIPEKIGSVCARGIASDHNGNIFIGFEGKNRIVQRKKIKNYVDCGTYITKTLDSTITNCRWHKVVLDLDEGSLKGTQVKLSYYASDKQEPDSFDRSEPLINPKDALLNAKGKYIWFKIELISDDQHQQTPLVKSLTVYFPRDSYLRYLPAVYQEDKRSRDFLERFLSLCETCLWKMENKIEGVTRYFDAGATPDEFLTWLSSWLGLSTDQNWPCEKRRELLREAPELFKKRGTREELYRLMEIYLEDPALIKELKIRIDQCQKSGTSEESLQGLGQLCTDAGKPIIVEHFQLRLVQELGSLATWARLFGNCPYCFCVLLKPFSVSNETELNTVRRIVQKHKPAHTRGGVVLLQPWLYVDMHTYLGINSILSEPEFILGKATIGRDTVVMDKEQSGQIDVRARVGIDTILT